jgi:hypothetical protein
MIRTRRVRISSSSPTTDLSGAPGFNAISIPPGGRAIAPDAGGKYIFFPITSTIEQQTVIHFGHAAIQEKEEDQDNASRTSL